MCAYTRVCIELSSLLSSLGWDELCDYLWLQWYEGCTSINLPEVIS